MMQTGRWAWLTVSIATLCAALYAQSAQVVYEQDDNAPGVTTDFRSPWNGGAVGNNGFMPHPTGRIIAFHDIIGFTFVVRVRLQAFVGGDAFGRLALVAGNGFWRTGNSAYNLPADRSNGLGPDRQAGTVMFGTWVGSGHQFGLRAAAHDNSLTAPGEARADVELRNASMVSLVSGPSPQQPNLAPYLWGGNRIDPTAFPTINLSWASGAITGNRGLISFDLFGTRASPHSDRLRLRTIFEIFRNGVSIFSDTDENFVDWGANDSTLSKGVGSVGDSTVLNISSDPNGTNYSLVLRVQVLHDGYRDHFGSYAGTVTLYDQSFTQSFIVQVPEPASLVALGVGLVGLLGLRRRKG